LTEIKIIPANVGYGIHREPFFPVWLPRSLLSVSVEWLAYTPILTDGWRAAQRPSGHVRLDVFLLTAHHGVAMKPLKTAAELRALILDEVGRKGASFDGIDVLVEPSRRDDGWVAYVIPPSGFVSWAEVAKLIGKVAAQYREQYDLDQE
jgi:hypothetical protein